MYQLLVKYNSNPQDQVYTPIHKVFKHFDDAFNMWLDLTEHQGFIAEIAMVVDVQFNSLMSPEQVQKAARAIKKRDEMIAAALAENASQTRLEL